MPGNDSLDVLLLLMPTLSHVLNTFHTAQHVSMSSSMLHHGGKQSRSTAWSTSLSATMDVLMTERLLCVMSQRPDAILPAMEGTRHEKEMTVAQFMEDIVLSSRPWIKRAAGKGGLASRLSALGASPSQAIPCIASCVSTLHA